MLLAYVFSPAHGGPVRVERARGEQILAVQKKHKKAAGGEPPAAFVTS